MVFGLAVLLNTSLAFGVLLIPDLLDVVIPVIPLDRMLLLPWDCSGLWKS